MVKFFLLAIIIFSNLHAAPIISQTGNLLSNGSFESGNYNPITGHGISSAASNWNQWANSGNPLTTELITETEMFSAYNLGIVDGTSALKVTAGGAGDGPYTVASWHSAWNSAGTAVPMTFSGWVYVVSGSMVLSIGSNSTGYVSKSTSKVGQWEFISITATSGIVDELLLYANESSIFIVDSVWLNKGITSTHPSQTLPIPEPNILFLIFLGITLFRKKIFLKKE